MICAVKTRELTWLFHKKFSEHGSTLLTIMSMKNDLRCILESPLSVYSAALL